MNSVSLEFYEEPFNPGTLRGYDSELDDYIWDMVPSKVRGKLLIDTYWLDRWRKAMPLLFFPWYLIPSLDEDILDKWGLASTLPPRSAFCFYSLFFLDILQKRVKRKLETNRE